MVIITFYGMQRVMQDFYRQQKEGSKLPGKGALLTVERPFSTEAMDMASSEAWLFQRT